ncbi:IS91 family transposase, partial [Salmonella enterica]
MARITWNGRCRTWTSFLDAGGLRDIEVEAVTKMLACGTRILGVKEFGCDNPDCQ